MKVRTRLGLVLFRQVISGKETTYWKVMAVNFSWTLNIEAWVFRPTSSMGVGLTSWWIIFLWNLWGQAVSALNFWHCLRTGFAPFANLQHPRRTCGCGHGHSNVAFGWPGDFWMEPDWCFDFANRERPSLVFEFVYLQTATCKGKRRT